MSHLSIIAVLVLLSFHVPLAQQRQLRKGENFEVIQFKVVLLFGRRSESLRGWYARALDLERVCVRASVSACVRE